MKKVILLFLVLGVSQVSAERLIKECTVTVPYQCVEVLDSSFDISSYDENKLVSLTVEVKCLVNSEEDSSIMAPQEYKVFLAVQTIPVKGYLQQLETQGVKVFNFVPSDLTPYHINFNRAVITMDVKQASLTCR